MFFHQWYSRARNSTDLESESPQAQGVHYRSAVWAWSGLTSCLLYVTKYCNPTRGNGISCSWVWLLYDQRFAVGSMTRQHLHVRLHRAHFPPIPSGEARPWQLHNWELKNYITSTERSSNIPSSGLIYRRKAPTQQRADAPVAQQQSFTSRLTKPL